MSKTADTLHENRLEVRPPVDPNMASEEFLRWYWPVDLLKSFCDALSIPASGLKAELRHRVAFALAHPGQPLPKPKRKRTDGKVNWAKQTLVPSTVITEAISFGPNVRNFFKQEIGSAFVCHSDFMDWVRANVGATLSDAVVAWRVLEHRKDDPDFRREIAQCNNYLQYLRDARDAVPSLSLEDAKACWDVKNRKPAQDGHVVFERSDIRVLGR
ncbi:MAG: DUF6434 domain-containing protein [Pseudomonadota bacterium]